MGVEMTIVGYPLSPEGYRKMVGGQYVFTTREKGEVVAYVAKVEEETLSAAGLEWPKTIGIPDGFNAVIKIHCEFGGDMKAIIECVCWGDPATRALIYAENEPIGRLWSESSRIRSLQEIRREGSLLR